jgi:hypothetical protein
MIRWDAFVDEPRTGNWVTVLLAGTESYAPDVLWALDVGTLGPPK